MVQDMPVFAADYAERPYWWDTAPRPRIVPAAFPRSADVAIVGSGVTGLSAAIVLARAGRSVVVFDAEDAGFGASTRNFGVIGRSLQHSFTSLERSRGLDYTLSVYRELQAAFDSVRHVIDEERIDCAFRLAGRFNIAVSPAHFDALAREYDAQRRHLGVDVEMISRQDQRREIAIEGDYHGGALIRDLGLLDPGRYHGGLLKAAMALGVQVMANTPICGLEKDGATIEVRLQAGSMRARDVIVATNGYTGKAFPWVRRRLVPFASFIVATEKLPAELVTRALPGNRNFTEATRNPYFLRQSPDGTRVLFGGMTGSPNKNLRPIVERLTRFIRDMVPDLGGALISRAWTGNCAGTFDLYPHLAQHEGVHYASGFCFAGLPMGTYLGRKAALKILGSPESTTIFERAAFPTMPLYNGKPWFLPLLFRWYARKDRNLRK
jgi:glycine/D-amino acid oxidase-like deaminating enzyme